MFDMSWGEIMLIGGVALVVIGPKDLPRALRTVGQVTGKLKRMAGEFQSQFNEAMREAELDEARREVEGLNRSVSSFNPVQTIRDEIKGAVESAGRPAPGALAAATAQLQADQAQADHAQADSAQADAARADPAGTVGEGEDAPDHGARPGEAHPAGTLAEAPALGSPASPAPEAPVAPPPPRPSIDGAPLVSPEFVAPEAAAGIEAAAPPAAPEAVPPAPPAPHPVEAKP